MVERSASYLFKMMSGDVFPVSFSYLVQPNNIKDFQVSFVVECRRIFPYILYDQLVLFDEKENIYNFEYIPENNCLFNIFIKERPDDMPKEYYKYYKDEWKGDMFRSYILWTEKISPNKLKVILAYCSVTNIIMTSFFNIRDRELSRRSNDSEDKWDFADDKSFYRYIFAKGLTQL